jgi:hypothetical protein
MNEQLKTLTQKLKEILESNDFSKVSKDTLIKIINLFNNTSDIDIITNIEKNILNKSYNDLELELTINRINSILSDFSKNYIKKIIYPNYSLYYYPTYVDIYIKQNNDKILTEIIDLNPKEVLLINNKSKHKQFIKNIDTSYSIITDFLNNNSPENIKIRIITKQ